MHNFHFKFAEHLKYYIIGSLSFIIIGIIIAAFFGVEMDINFKGGTRFTYVYSGEIELDTADSLIEETLGESAEVTQSTDISGNSSKLVISLASNQTVSTEVQGELTEALEKQFPENKLSFGDSNSVNPSVAGGFFAKSIFSIVLAGILVIVYIGIRFRKIGGISAGVMAFIALLHDVLIAFFCCIIFRLQIDTNFIAVVLTIFGYSLNDTVVIYDRIRENKRIDPTTPVRALVNNSINQTLGRTIVTAIATFGAILTVAVVSEIFGLTTLRSFAIPMCLGVISGCYSSICIAGPLWVKWCEYAEKRGPKKPRSKKAK